MSAWLSGSRGRAITAVATGLTAIGLAFAVSPRGCGGADRSPLGAVKAFEAAARAGDREQMYKLLGPTTRAKLDSAAARASRLKNKGTFGGHDMIGSVGQAAPAQYRLTSESRDRAVVEAVFESGETRRISLVYIDGVWRIELTTPTVPL